MAKLTGKNALIAGDSRTIRLTFPYDITGQTVFFTVKSEAGLSSADDTGAAISKTVTVHTDATSGITDIELTDDDTRITPGIYWFDVQIKDADGGVASAKKQQIEFVSDVTKRTS